VASHFSFAGPERRRARRDRPRGIADELAGLDGTEQLIADLAALVDAGLIEEHQSISNTRFSVLDAEQQGE